MKIPARRLREAGLLAILAVALGITVYGGTRLWLNQAGNRQIDALTAGRDVKVAHDAADAVLAARARFIIAHGKIEAAQAIADRLAATRNPPARAALLYALANAHLRHALQRFKIDPMKQVVPMINLAKSEYRQALQLDPENWDARYNLDIASNLVHDADPPPPTKGDTMAGERAFWPDLPGVPTGLP